MFTRRAHTSDSLSKSRTSAAVSKQKRSFRGNTVTTASKRVERAKKPEAPPPVERLFRQIQ